MSRLILCLFASVAFVGCPDVDPSNPYDPSTPAAQQAAGTLSGAVVLPDGFGAARLAESAVELSQDGELITRLALVADADAVPPRAPFTFEGVVGGRYAVRAVVPGFVVPAVRIELAIGASARLGDLEALPINPAGDPDAIPTGIEGVARRAGGGDTGHGGIRVDVVDTPYAAVTTAAGAFRLTLGPGAYTLRVSAEGHETETVADVSVTAEGVTALPAEVVLRGAPARLFGRVAPPEGADGAFDFAESRVALWPIDAEPAAEPLAQAAVDARGDFDLPGLDGGRYRLQAQREGFVGTVAAATVNPGEAAEVPGLALRIVLAEQGLLSGVARLAGAADHSDIRVELVGSARGATTNADGDWAFEAPPGVHTLRLTHPGYGTAQVQAPRLEAGGAALVDPVVLTADPGAVRGQVRIDPAFAGRDLLGQVAVRLAPIRADGTLGEAREAGAQPAADDPEQGTFAFADLSPGPYQIEARLEGFQPSFRALEVAPGAQVAAGVLFMSPAAAEAVVLGEARRGCAGCDHGGIRVEAVGTPFVALTNSDGAFRLAVTAGQFTLRYSAEGYGAEVSAPLAVAQGEPAQAAPVVLSALPAQVTGQILRLDGSGRRGPAVGATVAVVDAAGAVRAAGPVGADGTLALSVPGGAGPAEISVSLPRHVSAQRALALVPGAATDLGEVLLDLERGELRGVVAAPGLARGGSVTVIATGAVGDAVTAGLRQTVTPPPGDGAWALPNLPAGGWVLTAVAAGHVPSAAQPVQLGLGQSVQADLALALRAVQIEAPAVVAADEAQVTVGGDADLTFARAWAGVEPGPFVRLDAGRLTVPLPAEDGAVTLQVQAANALAADPAQAGDPLAFASEITERTIIRDTQAPDVWALTAPDLVAAPEVTVTLDCRDALAPSGALRVAVRVDGELAFEGPYVPRVLIPLPGGDGVRAIEATCTDWAGHTTAPLGQAVRVDRAGPTVQAFAVGDGRANLQLDAPRALVTVALEDADVAVATAIEAGALDCAAADYRWPAAGTFVVALPAGDGPRQLNLCAIDRAGNTTGPIASNGFIVDTTAPAVGRLSLAGGRDWTRAPQVALQVDTDEPGLRLALDGDVAAAEYAPGEWPAELVFLGGDGPKLVTARLIDAAGNASPAFSDTVTLDRQAPAAGQVALADGLAEVASRLIPITVRGTAPDTMRFWEGAPDAACAAVACEADGFVAFSPATEITLSEGQGAKRVCWQLCDRAGNAAPVGQGDLALGPYLPRPVPTLAAVQPSVVQAFQGPGRITLTGAGIAADTELVIGDFAVPCEGGAVDCQADAPGRCADACAATLPAAVLASAGTYAVSLRTPAPGGGRSDVQFLSVVAPIATVVDLTPRGVTPFDADGERIATLDVTVVGYDLLDNTTYRLEAVSGEVIDVQPIELAGVAPDRPQRAVTVRFDAERLPVPREGVRLTLSVVNPSPGGGTTQVPLGWNPELVACDVDAGCRSQLDRYRTPTADGAGVQQAYFMDWPAEGGVSWRGGARARLLVEGVASGLAAVAQAPVEVLPVPQQLGEGLVLEGPPVAHPGVDLVAAQWRSSGALDREGRDYRVIELQDVAQQVRVGDLTGDGWPDIVAAGNEVLDPARVGLTLLVGGPELADYRVVQRRVALGAGRLVALEVADVDGDDWPDVLAVMADQVQILRGGPDGLAPPLRLRHGGPALVDLALGEWDGDGRADGRLIDAEGALYGLTQEADGALRLRALPGQGGLPVRSLEAADLDGDGVTDLVGVAALADAEPVIAAFLSTRGFAAPVSSAAAPVYPHPELRPTLVDRYPGPILALGDLDGDGTPDAVHNDIGSGARVYRGLGDGRFELRQVLPRGINPATGRALDDQRDIQLLDMTGDGRLDLFQAASLNFGNKTSVAVPGRGDGTFPEPVYPNDVTLLTGLARIHDLDRDGRLDLVTYQRTARFLAFQFGAGGRPLDRLQVQDCAGQQCAGLAPTSRFDLGGDGRMDLVFAGQDRLGVLRLQANGSFAAPQFVAIENLLLGRPDVGPWAADGGAAAVVTQAFIEGDPPQRNVVLRVPLAADGAPGVPEPILGSDVNRRGVVVLPVPGGDPWLVEVLRTPDEVRFARYDPATNTLGAAATLPLPSGSLFRVTTRTADLDGDGDDDLVLLTQAGVALFRQTPAGLVAAGAPLGPCKDDVDVGDLDGDGHLDLVVGAHVNNDTGRQCASDRPGDGGLSVLWGDGDFGFEAQAIGGLSYNVTVDDMDGDGLDDIVHTGAEPVAQVGLYTSLPGRRFAPFLGRRVEDPVNATTTLDLDGDGVLDVAMNRDGQDPQTFEDRRGFLLWKRASPITQRLEAGGRVARVIPPGGSADIDLSGERRYVEQIGLSLQLQAAAPVDPARVTVRLTPPGGNRVGVPGMAASGDRLHLHAADIDRAGWIPNGPWRINVVNGSDAPVTVTEARVILVAGWQRALP